MCMLRENNYISTLVLLANITPKGILISLIINMNVMVGVTIIIPQRDGICKSSEKTEVHHGFPLITF